MNVLFIGIILTLLDLAVARYQIHRNPTAAAEARARADRRAVWPM